MSTAKNRVARKGFALPAVLAVTGVVTLIFLVAITALASLNSEAHSARERVRFIQRALTAEARMGYLFSTEPLRQNGILVGGAILTDLENDFSTSTDGLFDLIRTDGRNYLQDIDGPMLVSLQDQAGLINLVHLQGTVLTRFLDDIGIDSLQQTRVQARLTDYVDVDDLRQPEGAEKEDYGAIGVANRPLRRPSEFLSVLGLRDIVDRRAWLRVRDSIAADKSQSNINLNTATPATLRVMLGLTPSQIDLIVRERDISPLTSTYMVDNLVGSRLPWDPDIFYTSPSSSVLIVLRDSRSAWNYRARLSATPASLERPIWIDQTEMTEAPRRVRADTSNAVRLPYAPY